MCGASSEGPPVFRTISLDSHILLVNNSLVILCLCCHSVKRGQGMGVFDRRLEPALLDRCGEGVTDMAESFGSRVNCFLASGIHRMTASSS